MHSPRDGLGLMLWLRARHEAFLALAQRNLSVVHYGLCSRVPAERPRSGHGRAGGASVTWVTCPVVSLGVHAV